MKITHAALLCVATSATPCISWASTPNNGTLTPETKGLAIQYTVGPFTTSNPTPVPQVDDGPRCNAVAACDSFKLTITIPANSAFTTAKVRIDWPPSSASDYDLYICQGEKGDLDGATPADAGSSASSDNPETATIGLTPGTTAVYTIKVVAHSASDQLLAYQTYTTASATALEQSNGETVLRLGGVKVNISDIISVRDQTAA